MANKLLRPSVLAMTIRYHLGLPYTTADENRILSKQGYYMEAR